MLPMCFSVAPSVMLRCLAIPTFVRPSAMAARTSRSRGVRAGERIVGAIADHQLGDDLGIERRSAAGDPAQGVHELRDVADAVLEQVADAAGAVREELGRVLALDVLAEHEDRAAGHAPARLDRGSEPFVPLARWHPHVDHGHVRSMLRDRLDERVTVTDLRDDRAARFLDEPGDPFANQDRVLRDHDAERRVGRGHEPGVTMTLPAAWPSSTHRSASTTWLNG